MAHFAILHMMKLLKLLLIQHVIYHKTQLAAQLTKYSSVDVVLQYLQNGFHNESEAYSSNP